MAMKRIIRDYFYLARNDHLWYDIRLSVVVGIVIIAIAFFSGIGIRKVLEELYKSISVIITAFSILAGFNITSLSIFATSDSPVAKMLRSELIEGTDRKKIEQILAYFAWSIIMQLILLLFSIISSFILSYVLQIKPQFLIHAKELIAGAMWFTVLIAVIAILYSIVLTLRNISILYRYLVATP